MKKKILFVVLCGLLLLPISTFAETKTYDICKKGCKNKSILEVWREVNGIRENVDVVVNFKDAETYSFLDDFNSLEYYFEDDSELIDGELVEDPNEVFGYVCVDPNSGERVSVSSDRVYDYNTRDGYCVLYNEEEGSNLTAVYISNPFIQSFTINGYEDGMTTIDIVDSTNNDLFAGISNLFFMGNVNTKLFVMNNIKLIGSFYAGANRESVTVLNHCDLPYGLLAYGDSVVSVNNSKVNRIYAIDNGIVYLHPTSNTFYGDAEYIKGNDMAENMSDVGLEDYLAYINGLNDSLKRSVSSGLSIPIDLVGLNLDFIFNTLAFDGKSALIEESLGKIIFYDILPEYHLEHLIVDKNQNITNPYTGQSPIFIVLFALLILGFTRLRRSKKSY